MSRATGSNTPEIQGHCGFIGSGVPYVFLIIPSDLDKRRVPLMVVFTAYPLIFFAMVPMSEPPGLSLSM